MNEGELANCYALLGVPPGSDRAAVEKALMQRNFALIRACAPESEREQLRAAHDAIVAHLDATELARHQTAHSAAKFDRVEAGIAQREADADAELHGPEFGAWDPRSFDSWRINAFMPPLAAGLAILVQLTPLGFLLTGFHVWIHEFGHATVGWLTGHRALPLPIGWTSMAPEKSSFVYFGILFLLGLLFVAGARERKIWPMVLSVLLALAQAYMTWRLPESTAEMWIDFAGVGGEFYLAAAMVGLFYFRLPEKFRWGGCRYVFLFIGAGSFFATDALWRKIYRGEEGIPYGSMINGEEDAGGDMNGLHDGFGWSQHDIIFTYHHLANACLVALVVLYLCFALRVDKFFARLLER